MRHERNELVWYACLAVVVSWCCTVVYLHVLGDTINGIPAWHQGFLDNEAFAPSQYRLTGFAIPELLTRVGIGITDAYLALRFLYLAAALAVTALIGRRMGLDIMGASFLVAAVGVYYASATQAHYQPAEELNLLVFGLMILLILMDARIIWFVIVVIVGTLTKSTVGFALPFFALASLAVLRRPRHVVARDTALLGAIFAIGYVGLRSYFGTDRPYLGGLWQIDDNITDLRAKPEEALLWLLASLLPLAFIAARWKTTTTLVKCFVPTAILFIVGHLAISKIVEWRTYTPLALLLWPAVFVALFGNANQPGKSVPRRP